MPVQVSRKSIYQGWDFSGKRKECKLGEKVSDCLKESERMVESKDGRPSRVVDLLRSQILVGGDELGR